MNKQRNPIVASGSVCAAEGVSLLSERKVLGKKVTNAEWGGDLGDLLQPRQQHNAVKPTHTMSPTLEEIQSQRRARQATKPAHGGLSDVLPMRANRPVLVGSIHDGQKLMEVQERRAQREQREDLVDHSESLAAILSKRSRRELRRVGGHANDPSPWRNQVQSPLGSHYQDNRSSAL